MRRILLILMLITSVLFSKDRLHAQEEYGKNFIGAKVLFLEYQNMNSSEDRKITNGVEIFYQHNFGKFFSISVPAKFGALNLPKEENNRRFMGADGLFHIHYYNPEARFFPYLFAGGGIVWEEFEESNFQFPMGGGLNIRVGRDSYVNLQGEYRRSEDRTRDNAQAGVGFMYRFSKQEPDTDGDGVKDSADACPDTPGAPDLAGCPDRDGDLIADRLDQCPDVPGVAALNGCPDSDGDGIGDRDDQCPNEAGVAALNGCPDRDGDEVPDRFDRCPDEAGSPSNNGCPILDSDGDGIPDEQDDCPTEAGPRVTRGCPDRDGDGFADNIDRCPDNPGTYAGCPDTDGDGLVDPEDRCPDEAGPIGNRGCPELEPEVKEVLDLATQAVQFETGRATLKSESFETLNQIAGILAQYPSYKMRISGHTDDTGDDNNNQILSEERAKACYQYIVSQGISPDRLSYAGYGETRPIADNKTRQGRTLNRRVEFEIYLD